MYLQGNATKATERIIAAFQSGNVPRPLAQTFIQHGNVPMDKWSVLNRFVCVLSGCTDARGFKQWQEYGRFVRKGETAAAYILIPLTKRVKGSGEDDEETAVLYGFKGLPVFDITQTDGQPLPEQVKHQAFIDSLPLIEVARNHFGLTVETFDGRKRGAAGIYYQKSKRIGLAVTNTSTWLHELIHAADHKLGNLTEAGQHWASETVAELGGATLAYMLGMEVEADLGGAWAYISHYAEAAGIQPVTACLRMLDRTAQAIQLILDVAGLSQAAASSS